jgi:hypothetical protein
MNACTPLIDHYLKPRVYGRDRRGQPLQVAEAPQPSSQPSVQSSVSPAKAQAPASVQGDRP